MLKVVLRVHHEPRLPGEVVQGTNVLWFPFGGGRRRRRFMYIKGCQFAVADQSEKSHEDKRHSPSRMPSSLIQHLLRVLDEASSKSVSDILRDACLCMVLCLSPILLWKHRMNLPTDRKDEVNYYLYM